MVDSGDFHYSDSSRMQNHLDYWKGQIAYCDPTKSGSSYTQLCTMILAKGGSDSGWDFVKEFYANLDGKLVDSSGKCHKLVKDGVLKIIIRRIFQLGLRLNILVLVKGI